MTARVTKRLVFIFGGVCAVAAGVAFNEHQFGYAVPLTACSVAFAYLWAVWPNE